MSYADSRFAFRLMSSMARRCSIRRRYECASKYHETKNHAQASAAVNTLTQATNAVVSPLENVRAATTDAASAATKNGMFFMKAARRARLLRICRNTALCAITLILLNGTLIAPAILAIDVFALLITLGCLVVFVGIELTRKGSRT